MTDTLSVHLHDTPVGAVTRGAQQHLVEFTWDEALSDVDVAMTANRRIFPGRAVTSRAVSDFIGGYTPEGNARSHLASSRGLSEHDLFGLLSAFGASIAGALTFRPMGGSAAHQPRYDALGEADLAQSLARSIRDHDLHARDDSQSMLPGFQPKLLVAKFGDSWLAPHGRAHSTHILKPVLRSRPDAVPNEYYSHLLARDMGLSRFASEMLEAEGQRYLAIERFDRIVEGDTVRLVHQEDMAQAIGLDWRYDFAKFDRDPSRNWRHLDIAVASARSIAAIVDELGGAAAITSWLRQLTYHVAIGNNDAHAKNVSLVHTDGGSTLSQVYDAIPNFSQEDRSNFQIALKIAGVGDHRLITLGHLVDEAVAWDVGITESRATSVIDACLDALDAAIHRVALPDAVSERVPARIAWNIERLRDGAQIMTPPDDWY